MKWGREEERLLLHPESSALQGFRAWLHHVLSSAKSPQVQFLLSNPIALKISMRQPGVTASQINILRPISSAAA